MKVFIVIKCSQVTDKYQKDSYERTRVLAAYCTRKAARKAVLRLDTRKGSCDSVTYHVLCKSIQGLSDHRYYEEGNTRLIYRIDRNMVEKV